MQYLKPIFIKKCLASLLLFIGFFVISPSQSSIYGQYCDNDGITATLTYPYNGNSTQALVDRNGGRGNEGIAVWRVGDPKPGYSGDDPYLATNLLCGSTYNYEAYTRNSCAGSDTFGGTFPTNPCAATPVPTLPPPTGQNYTCNTNGTLTVRWNAVTGASGYIARLDYQGSMSGPVIHDWQNLALNDQVAQPTAINYTFPITYGTRYQWAVSTKNSANVGGSWSWNSPAFSCTAPPPITRTLTTAANPAGSGTFQCSTTSASTGFGACAATYVNNTTVYVRANAATNYGFTSFATGHGCTTVSSNVCTYAMTANRSITANFALVPRTLTTAASPAGSGSFQCSTTSASTGFGACAASYTHGTTVYLRANPAATYIFSSFATGNPCTTTTGNVCTLAMTANRSVTANFALRPDLTPGAITRDPPGTSGTEGYDIIYCNNGPAGASTQTFIIRIVNTVSGAVTTRTVTIPAIGAANCGTATVPCSQLGDTYGGINCNETSSIDVTLDFGATVSETNEGNNTSNGNTFSALASEPFYKLSNASLHRLQAIDVSMPAGIQAYDAVDDTTDPFLIVKGGAGITSTTSTIRVVSASGYVSTNNIRRENYTDADTYLNALSTFTTYATAQKPINSITDYNQVASNTINIYTGSLPLVITGAPTSNATDFVLLVNGNVTLNQVPTFNTVADNSIAIISTGTISINPAVTTVNAILIGNAIDLGTSVNPLKINGNLISNTATTITRNRATNPDIQPNVFIVFNPKMYLDLLPHLSDITVEGRQVQ